MQASRQLGSFCRAQPSEANVLNKTLRGVDFGMAVKVWRDGNGLTTRIVFTLVVRAADGTETALDRTHGRAPYEAAGRFAMSLLKALSNAWGRVFVRRGDNFKALLMADLGLKR